MGTDTIPDLGWELGVFSLILSNVFFSFRFAQGPMLVTSPLNPLGGALADLWSFLSAALISLALCPMSSRCVGLSILGFFFLNLVWWLGSIWVYLPWIGALTPRDVSWLIKGLTLFFSHLLRDHSSSLPGVQRLTNHCFIYFVLVFPGHFRWEGKSDSCYSMLVGSRGFGYEELQINVHYIYMGVTGILHEISIIKSVILFIKYFLFQLLLLCAYPKFFFFWILFLNL